MRIISDYKHCQNTDKGSAVAIGNFDGMHKGHIAVIRKMQEIAATLGVPASILTFEPHPLEVLRPGAPPFRLMSREQKVNFCRDLGVQNLFILEFNKNFSQIKAGEFIQDILIKELAVKHVVTGADFLFGFERSGDASALAEPKNGFGYTKLMSIGGPNDIFSSTAIRGALAKGALEVVRRMLGRNFIIEGAVESGNGRGSKIGFPTANVDMARYIRPAFGVYAVSARIEGREEALKGVANIGVRPTIGESKELLEVHIFDFSRNIYGNRVSIELIEYIRPEVKFNNIDELKLQIMRDSIKAMEVLA